MGFQEVFESPENVQFLYLFSPWGDSFHPVKGGRAKKEKPPFAVLGITSNNYLQGFHFPGKRDGAFYNIWTFYS